MKHADCKKLIGTLENKSGNIWADFGSGTGTFTFALAELLGENSLIISVEKDVHALNRQKITHRNRYSNYKIHFLLGDFTSSLKLPDLDGILMANALHFVKEKRPFLRKIRSTLKPRGQFILIEYDVQQGNPWVPHPITFENWKKLAGQVGFKSVKYINEMPSRFHKRIYSCANS